MRFELTWDIWRREMSGDTRADVEDIHVSVFRGLHEKECPYSSARLVESSLLKIMFTKE